MKPDFLCLWESSTPGGKRSSEDSMARDVFYDSFLSDQVGSVGKLLSCCNKSFKNYFSEPKVNNKWELPNGQNLPLK